MPLRVNGFALLDWVTDSGTTLTIRVKVLEARSNYGRTDFLVTPASGGGQAWVQEDKLEALRWIH